MFPIFLLVTSLLCVQSAPLQSNETQQYDASQFDEVHDQRQNGTENWRVNLDKIVLVWSPPGGLLTAALLADTGLLENEEFSDVDDFYKPDKPNETVVIKPEASTKPPESTGQNSTVGTNSVASRRRLRVPGFLRPFVRRHPVQS